MITIKHLRLIPLLALLIVAGCKEKTVRSVNIEQLGNPLAEKILAPGLGTIGLINEDKVFTYFLNEEGAWMLDKLSQFNIPEDNQGLLALGLGTMGVVQDTQIHFYRLDANNEWVSEPRLTFDLPAKYDRIFSVKMPWELGLIAIAYEGIITFYYREENGAWILDETASFALPPDILNYFSLGDMTIAVTDQNHKMGFYFLNPEGSWEFADQYVLQLPVGYQAIIPWESSIIAVLMGQGLEFYAFTPDEGGWLNYEDMAFTLPITHQP